MPPLKITYKIQFFDKSLGFWNTRYIVNGEQYDEATRLLYGEYKLDNSLQYRLVQVKEELVDSLYPPGS